MDYINITKWEYTSVLAGQDDDLNQLGKLGWEACGMNQNQMFMKRPCGNIKFREKEPIEKEEKKNHWE